MAGTTTKRPQTPPAPASDAAVTRMLAAPIPSRRAFLAGLSAPALATALTLPVKAAAEPHADTALFAAEASYREAEEACAAATKRFRAAQDAFRAEISFCPQALVLTGDERAIMGGPATWRSDFRFVRLRWAYVEHGGDRAGMAHAWTAEALRLAIHCAVSALGRGGRTPQRIRRWRELLPVAEAFDARWSELEARHEVERLRAVAKAADGARLAAETRLYRIPAVTIEGLALKVRYMDGTNWMGMAAPWIALLQSAAILSGVTLREPQLNCERWAAELRAAGGSVTWYPDRGEGRVHFPVDHTHTSEQRARLTRLSEEHRVHRSEIAFWLSQGGAA